MQRAKRSATAATGRGAPEGQQDRPGRAGQGTLGLRQARERGRRQGGATSAAGDAGDAALRARLREAGIPDAVARGLARRYGTAGLRALMAREPYRLAETPEVQVAHVDALVAADRLAVDRLGRDRLGAWGHAPERVAHGVGELLAGAARAGHAGVPRGTVERVAGERLGLGGAGGTRAVREGIALARARGWLREDGGLVYLADVWSAEVECAAALARLAVRGRPVVEGRARREALARATLGRDASDEGVQALATLLEGGVRLLVGRAGRGKSTLVGALVRAVEATGGQCCLVATTGAAARQLAEATRRPAATLHRGLGLRREDGGTWPPRRRRHGGRRLEARVIVIDEAGMLGTTVAAEVLRRVDPARSALVLVGDTEQLGPIGPGRVLRSCLVSGVIPAARLMEPRRTRGRELIAGTDAIADGRVPTFQRGGTVWRVFDPTQRGEARGRGDGGGAGRAGKGAGTDEARRIVRWVVEGVQRYGEALGVGDPWAAVQVYAPHYGGPTGVDALNEALQRAARRQRPAVEDTARGGERSRDGVTVARGARVWVGDKVVQTENDYALRDDLGRAVDVMNGEVGWVTRSAAYGGAGRQVVEVRFPLPTGVVRYETPEQWGRLAPAYALSVHRAQGCGVPYAFVVLGPDVPEALLRREVVYTAASRAREGCAIFGAEARLARAVARGGHGGREEGLAGRIAGAVQRERRSEGETGELWGDADGVWADGGMEAAGEGRGAGNRAPIGAGV